MKTLPPIAPATTSAACGHLAAAPLDVGHGRDCRGPSGRPVDRCTVRAWQAYQMGRVNWADTRLLQQSGICASTSRSSPAGGACSAAGELTDTAFDCPPAPAWCTVCLRCLAITVRDAGLQRVRPVCASWAPVCPLTAAWGRVAAGTGHARPCLLTGHLGHASACKLDAIAARPCPVSSAHAGGAAGVLQAARQETKCVAPPRPLRWGRRVVPPQSNSFGSPPCLIATEL